MADLEKFKLSSLFWEGDKLLAPTVDISMLPIRAYFSRLAGC